MASFGLLLVAACTTFGTVNEGDGGVAPPAEGGVPADASLPRVDASPLPDGAPIPRPRFCEVHRRGVCADFDDGKPNQLFVEDVERTAAVYVPTGASLSVVTKNLLATTTSSPGATGAFLALPANIKGRFRFSMDVFDAPKERTEIAYIPNAAPLGRVSIWASEDRIEVGSTDAMLASFGRPSGPFTVVLTADSFGVALASQIPMTISMSQAIVQIDEIRVGVSPPKSSSTPDAVIRARLDDVWLIGE